MLKSYHSAMGVIEGGQRQTSTSTEEMLHWKMSIPLAEPLVEIVPFITDWSGLEAHPMDNLPEFCLLKLLIFYHPQPANTSPVFKGLGLMNEVIPKNSATIIAKIETPAGLLILA
jgi:hypothetical protein